jgi:hypothetical protein
MNEFDLIKRYLSTVGCRVFDVKYFRQDIHFPGPAGYDIGAAQGIPVNHGFFFGNVSIYNEISGVIVLTNQMLNTVYFTTLLYNALAETGDTFVGLGVNCGMSLLGNGIYVGSKRIYGISCNRVSVDGIGFGAADFSIHVFFNGYMFTII